MKNFDLVSANFFQCISTGDVFAVKMRWNGDILGAAGPLSPDALRSPDQYTYTDELIDFISDRNDKLILMNPAASC